MTSSRSPHWLGVPVIVPLPCASVSPCCSIPPATAYLTGPRFEVAAIDAEYGAPSSAPGSVASVVKTGAGSSAGGAGPVGACLPATGQPVAQTGLASAPRWIPAVVARPLVR